MTIKTDQAAINSLSFRKFGVENKESSRSDQNEIYIKFKANKTNPDNVGFQVSKNTMSFFSRMSEGKREDHNDRVRETSMQLNAMLAKHFSDSGMTVGFENTETYRFMEIITGGNDGYISLLQFNEICAIAQAEVSDFRKSQTPNSPTQQSQTDLSTSQHVISTVSSQIDSQGHNSIGVGVITQPLEPSGNGSSSLISKSMEHNLNKVSDELASNTGEWPEAAKISLEDLAAQVMMAKVLVPDQSQNSGTIREILDTLSSQIDDYLEDTQLTQTQENLLKDLQATIQSYLRGQNSVQEITVNTPEPVIMEAPIEYTPKVDPNALTPRGMDLKLSTILDHIQTHKNSWPDGSKISKGDLILEIEYVGLNFSHDELDDLAIKSDLTALILKIDDYLEDTQLTQTQGNILKDLKATIQAYVQGE